MEPCAYTCCTVPALSAALTVLILAHTLLPTRSPTLQLSSGETILVAIFFLKGHSNPTNGKVNI